MNPTCFEPKVGILVNVTSRTWPGINKAGGVGRVTGINYEDGAMIIDVEYVLGGKEKGIELEFVAEHTFDQENHGRPSRRRRSSAAADEKKDIATATINEGEPKKKNAKKKNALKDASSKANKAGNNTDTKTLKRKPVGVTKPAKAKKVKVALESKERDSKKKKSGLKQRHKKDDSKKETKQPASVAKREAVQSTAAFASISAPAAAATASVARSSFEKSEESPSRVTGVLRSVYTDMSKKAATFVSDIIGKIGSASSSASASASEPSSPESTASLELQLGKERAERFNTFFSDVMRKKMVDAIEIDELRDEINLLNKDEPYSELELRTHLERLDKESKVMVTWDTGTIYIL